MSSILKALKKLEHEKTDRLPHSLRIDTDILRSVDSSRGVSPYSLALLFLLVFGGGAAVAFYFLKDTKAPQNVGISQPAAAAKVLQADSPHQAVKPKALSAGRVVVPARREHPARKQQMKPAAAGKAGDNRAVKAAVSGISAMQKEADGAVPAAAIPLLRVNGIAFQNSGAASMAIVNGIPVSGGSIIEGTTVDEVQKDRVLFQRNGEKFEILLGQSNR